MFVGGKPVRKGGGGNSDTPMADLSLGVFFYFSWSFLCQLSKKKSFFKKNST